MGEARVRVCLDDTHKHSIRANSNGVQPTAQVLMQARPAVSIIIIQLQPATSGAGIPAVHGAAHRPPGRWWWRLLLLLMLLHIGSTPLKRRRLLPVIPRV